MTETPDGRAIVGFDFDGTLTVRDSFTSFLRWRTTGAAGTRALLRMASPAWSFLSDGDRGRLKAAAVRICLRGVAVDDLARDCERFAVDRFERLIRPDALAAWREHQSCGDRLVIVTASPEPVVQPFARRLGADGLIGTRLEEDAYGRLTGEFKGPNCRGAEKVRRLYNAFGPVRLTAAYGDTAGDQAMLDIADHPHMKAFKAKPS